MKWLAAGAVWALALALAAAPAWGQFGIGGKVPPIVLPQAFLSLIVADALVFEVVGLVSLSSASAFASLKWRLGRLRLLGFSLRPLLGVGGGVYYLETLQGGIVTPTVKGLLGAEYPLAGSRLSVLTEVDLYYGRSMFGAGFTVQLNLGLRHDF